MFFPQQNLTGNNIISIPHTPPKVDLNDLDENGMLLPPAEVARIMSLHLPDGHHHKSETNCKYSLFVKDGECYAIYYGMKHNHHLGAGAFGKVKLAQNILTGKWAAEKIARSSASNYSEFPQSGFMNPATNKNSLFMKDNGESSNQFKLDMLKDFSEVDFLKRAQMLTETNSTHKVFCFNRYSKKTYYNMVNDFLMKYIPGVELDTFIKKPKSFPPSLYIKIAIDLISQLKFLHSKNICHQDLHNGNIIFDFQQCKMHIIDLGNACNIASSQSDISYMCDHIKSLTDIDMARKLTSESLNIYSVNSIPILDSMIASLQEKLMQIDKRDDFMSIGVIDLNNYRKNFPSSLITPDLIYKLNNYAYIIMIDSSAENNKSCFAAAQQALQLENIFVYDKAIANTTINDLKSSKQLESLMQSFNPDYAYRFCNVDTKELITQCDETSKKIPLHNNKHPAVESHYNLRMRYF